ncbi:MAG: flavodoxin [Candidatus Malihini olakiniferum]
MAKIGIFVGTVYGSALLVAEEAGNLLSERGHQVKVFDCADLSSWLEYCEHYVLVVTSTTGQGDLPGSISPLFSALREKRGYHRALRYGLIALGNSSYPHFCGAGQKFNSLLQEMGAKQVGDALKIDEIEYPQPEILSCPWIKGWAKLVEAS